MPVTKAAVKAVPKACASAYSTQIQFWPIKCVFAAVNPWKFQSSGPSLLTGVSSARSSVLIWVADIWFQRKGLGTPGHATSPMMMVGYVEKAFSSATTGGPEIAGPAYPVISLRFVLFYGMSIWVEECIFLEFWVSE